MAFHILTVLGVGSPFRPFCWKYGKYIFLGIILILLVV